MLPSTQRLSRHEFTKTLQNKDIMVVYNRLGTLKYIPSKRAALSVVTSSKHEKRAVLRNKLRRRVYSLFQTNKTGIRGILYTSKAGTTLSYPELKRLFYELLNKTNSKIAQ